MKKRKKKVFIPLEETDGIELEVNTMMMMMMMMMLFLAFSLVYFAKTRTRMTTKTGLLLSCQINEEREYTHAYMYSTYFL